MSEDKAELVTREEETKKSKNKPKKQCCGKFTLCAKNPKGRWMFMESTGAEWAQILSAFVAYWACCFAYFGVCFVIFMKIRGFI